VTLANLSWDHLQLGRLTTPQDTDGPSAYRRHFFPLAEIISAGPGTGFPLRRRSRLLVSDPLVRADCRQDETNQRALPAPTPLVQKEPDQEPTPIIGWLTDPVASIWWQWLRARLIGIAEPSPSSRA